MLLFREHILKFLRSNYRDEKKLPPYFFSSFFISFVIRLLIIGTFVSSCYADKTSILFHALEIQDYEFFLKADNQAYRQIRNMGQGSAYFIGLHLKSAKHTDAARFYFEKGAALYAEPFKRLCNEALYTTGSVEKRLQSVTKRLQALHAIKTAEAEEEIRELTDLQTALYLQLHKYAQLPVSVETLYQTNQLTQEMVNVFPKAAAEMSSSAAKLTQGRIFVFEKNYAAAWNQFAAMLYDTDTFEHIAYAPVLSDIGKAAVYGAEHKQAAIVFFSHCIQKAREHKTGIRHGHNIIEEKKAHTVLFYSFFYIARISTRIDSIPVSEAAALFKKSLEYAQNAADYDTALWYYLDTIRSGSIDFYTAELIRTAASWNNPAWYADLLEDFNVKLTIKKDWKNLKKLHQAGTFQGVSKQLDGVLYTLARMGRHSGMLTESEQEAYFRRIIEHSASNSYYCSMSNYVLHEPISLFTQKKKIESGSPLYSMQEAEAVLDGLIKFNLLDRIYPDFSEMCAAVSPEKAVFIAEKLAHKGLYAQSIRMMSAYLRQNAHPADSVQLRLVYPRPWKDFVEKYAAKYHIPPYFLYALIRSESFFQPKVVSHAGAIGLTQLMPPTAADIAKKLKITDYSLTDPETNIAFGAYYLSEMIRRLNKKLMPACCAYNAGITRVRIWQRDLKDIPDDIFLESIGYAETRGYGKKILTAALAYGVLYYNKKPEAIIAEFFPNLR